MGAELEGRDDSTEHTLGSEEGRRRQGVAGRRQGPADLQRRLNAASAALELVDREFSEIARLAEEYKSAVQLKEASVADDSLSVVALEQILKGALERSGQVSEIKHLPDGVADLIVEELRCFGVTTVQDAQKLVDSERSRKFFEKRSEIKKRGGIFIYRALMLLSDARKFFDCAKGRLKTVSAPVYQHYLEIAGDQDIDDLMAEFNLKISPGEP